MCSLVQSTSVRVLCSVVYTAPGTGSLVMTTAAAAKQHKISLSALHGGTHCDVVQSGGTYRDVGVLLTVEDERGG